MTVEHSDIIEKAIASDHRVVTYRLLSRLASIHVNLAKKILYGYYQDANSKSPGSINATYVLSGLRKIPPKENAAPTVQVEEDGDAVMQSSPLDSLMRSSPPPQGSRDSEEEEEELEAVVLLVAEDKVQETIKTFKAITAYHVYSIQAQPPEALSKLGAIEDMTRAQYPPKDITAGGKDFGAIVCEGVEYRGKQPPAYAMPSAKAKAKAAPKPAPEVKKESPKRETPKEEKKTNFFGKAAGSKPPTATVEKKEPKSTVPAKRTQADFFKRTPTAATKSAPPKKAQKVESKLESDDEEVEEEPKIERDLAKEEALRKKKKEDEDALKAMMDMDDDVEMEDTPAAPGSPDWEEPAEEEPLKTLDAKPEAEPAAKEPNEIATETSGGRRRGRRKVKKSRTVKDERGYLETKFEEVWESFSEDEPEPPKVKKEVPVKKAPVKKGPKGQGSIMSFFGKK